VPSSPYDRPVVVPHEQRTTKPSRLEGWPTPAPQPQQPPYHPVPPYAEPHSPADPRGRYGGGDYYDGHHDNRPEPRQRDPPDDDDRVVPHGQPLPRVDKPEPRPATPRRRNPRVPVTKPIRH
jgi:hypothetical protein